MVGIWAIVEGVADFRCGHWREFVSNHAYPVRRRIISRRAYTSTDRVVRLAYNGRPRAASPDLNLIDLGYVIVAVMADFDGANQHGRAKIDRCLTNAAGLTAPIGISSSERESAVPQ